MGWSKNNKMIRTQCRHYVGRKPCSFKRACEGCTHFEAKGERILVIKLGALGDLVRTTCIIDELKAQYPKSYITWLTLKECKPLLEGIKEIDQIWEIGAFTLAQLHVQEFDLMLNFDKETPAVEFATAARARIKRGFGLNLRGELVALNPASQYSLEMGVDDELKFNKNQKTYQQICLEMAELAEKAKSQKPNYRLELTANERTWAQKQIAQAFPQAESFLGINPGAGKVFATKKWIPARYIEVAARAHREHALVPMLLGGPDERELLDQLELEFKAQKIPYFRPGENHSLRQFAALIGECDAMLVGDTLAMHLALAQKVKTLVVFTSTCHQEIETYDWGAKVIGQAACAPCYLSQCNQPEQFCAKSISVEHVYRALSKLLVQSLDNTKDQKKAA